MLSVVWRANDLSLARSAHTNRYKGVARIGRWEVNVNTGGRLASKIGLRWVVDTPATPLSDNKLRMYRFSFVFLVIFHHICSAKKDYLCRTAFSLCIRSIILTTVTLKCK